MKEKIKIWLKNNWLETFFLLLIVIFIIKLPQQHAIPFFKEIILLIIGYIFAILLQRKKNRPEVVTHGCRILGQPVYTYFDPDNNNSEPACPYLLKGGRCGFQPNNQNSKQNTEWDNNGDVKFWGIEDKKKMLEVNDGKCYLVLWNQKIKK